MSFPHLREGRLCAGRDPLVGAQEPDHISLVAIKVLQANQDPRADHLLDIGYQYLQERAAELEDEEDRRIFFENVAWRNELVAMWQSWQQERAS